MQLIKNYKIMEVSVIHLLKKENQLLSGHILPLPVKHKRCLKQFSTKRLNLYVYVCERGREGKLMPLLLLIPFHQVLLFHHQIIYSYNSIPFKVLLYKIHLELFCCLIITKLKARRYRSFTSTI